MRRIWVLLLVGLVIGGTVVYGVSPRKDQDRASNARVEEPAKLEAAKQVPATATTPTAVASSVGGASMHGGEEESGWLADDLPLKDTIPVPKITAISYGDNFKWPIDQTLTKLRSGSFTIHLEGNFPKDSKFSLLRLPPKAGLLAPQERVAVTVTPGSPSAQEQTLAVAQGALTSGRHKLLVHVELLGNQPKDSEPFDVFVPSGSIPQILSVANGRYADFVSPPTTPIQVYEGFLALKVSPAPPKSALKFFVLATDGQNIQNVVPFDAVSPSIEGDNWKVVLTIPTSKLANGINQKLIVRLDELDNFSYSEPLTFQNNPVADPLPTPEITDIKKVPVNGAEVIAPSLGGEALLNVKKFKVIGRSATPPFVPNSQVLIFQEGSNEYIGKVTISDASLWEVLVDGKLPDGRHQLTARVAQGDKLGPTSSRKSVIIRTQGPRVVSVQPPNFGTAPGVQTLTIQFDPQNPLVDTRAKNKANYILRASSGGTGVFDQGTDTVIGTTNQPTDPEFDSARNVVILRYQGLPANIYRLEIVGFPVNPAIDTDNTRGIRDIFDNPLEGVEGKPGTDYKIVLGKPAACDEAEASAFPSLSRGITGTSGPYVPFMEFTKPRTKPDGFNPSDHVETRVARLYYYRDAHRVAQIINRDVKSYNRVAVDTRRREADRARDKAAVLTDERRAFERAAVEAARQAREVERQLQQAQQDLSTALQAIQAAPTDEAAKQRASAAVARVQALQVELQVKRTAELQANEKGLAATAKEDRAREDQFRKEVAAAHEDPDTYAPGKPDSNDPVQQVSVSVIGEAVIQLRGPIKGINIIRTMINQIDSPAGQVRVAIHTVQVNGERGDRMERVVSRIQDYIDHSRFLTVQSALMLRKAVILVASRKADQASLTCPFDSQEARDLKYLHGFFGRDFIEELRTADSEFLKTGNKLLSLHSMDTTSLASALFLLSLAKNSTRLEILQEFQRMLAEQLPTAEQSYFEAGGERRFGKGLYDKIYDKCCDQFTLLAQNARFQSFLGFFNSEIMGDDTLSPIQREFIRLAQIFKSQLITELEVRQRVMERGVIEERIGNYEAELQAAKKKEDEANKELEDSRKLIGPQRGEVLAILAEIDGTIASVGQGLSELRSVYDPFYNFIEEEHEKYKDELKKYGGKRDYEGNFRIFTLGGKIFRLRYINESGVELKIQVDPKPNAPGKEKEWTESFKSVVNQALRIRELIKISQSIDQRVYPEIALNWRSADKFLEELLDRLEDDNFGILATDLDNLSFAMKALSKVTRELQVIADGLRREAQVVVQLLSRPDGQVSAIYQAWSVLRGHIDETLKLSANVGVTGPARKLMERADNTLTNLLRLEARYQMLRRTAEEARRPLDHKKFLDMLIDEMEDKNIELLEGTRSHTANIDDYIKRLATALEDDFNTQFYFPAFREVRQASRYWDVSFAQVETTSILTNNRMFAKVEPQATMEFDLPRRDIVMVEAMKGAKGLVDSYGALLQDPTFLALTKMRSGQPTSSLAQGQAPGLSEVRNVLPGLPRQADERIMTQTGPRDPEFAAALEGLIPDPAIYKFETGTGYELRPVIAPDGQSVVFHFFYMYTTNIREPVKADEKHLGRVKRHFIDTNVQLGNYELREISRYQVALKAARTSRGVPLLEDIPGLGLLFRPLPSAESSLQQNLILGQTVIYPTLFDLMGLRWAPAVADLEPLSLSCSDFTVRNRRRDLINHVFDYSTSRVDEFLRIPPAERRTDLYRTQETIPSIHPNGYYGPGLNLRDSQMREGYDVRQTHPETRFTPREAPNGAGFRSGTSPSTIPPYPMPPAVRPPSESYPPNGVPMPYSPTPSGAPPNRATEMLPQPRVVPQGQGQQPSTMPPAPDGPFMEPAAPNGQTSRPWNPPYPQPNSAGIPVNVPYPQGQQQGNMLPYPRPIGQQTPTSGYPDPRYAPGTVPNGPVPGPSFPGVLPPVSPTPGTPSFRPVPGGAAMTAPAVSGALPPVQRQGGNNSTSRVPAGATMLPPPVSTTPQAQPR